MGKISVKNGIEWDVLQFKAQVLKALAHPTRLALTELLMDGELCVCELIESLGLEQAIISKHLQVLRKAGLVVSRKDGLNIYYKIACPCIKKLLSEITTTIRQIANRQQEVFNKI